MTVLIVDDEITLRAALRRHLRQRGVETAEASTLDEATAALSERPFDIVLVDVVLPDGLGLDLIDRARTMLNRRPAFIVMTGQDLNDHAVSALRKGARDFLAKPFSMEALDDALLRLEQAKSVRMKAPVSKRAIDTWRRINAPGAYGSDPQYLRALDIVRRVADTDCAVLVTGETGTGKEVIAQAVHRASGRREKPFVAVNCAAIPETLIESELFGHAKGAFTGATAAHKGRFAHADGGTLFLDEIGEMPPQMQAKLLRVLQEGEITPVGEQHSQRVNVRVVAATHRDVDALAREGTFREDLLYRLDVVRIELPPLRARSEDFAGLVRLFIQEASERRGSKVNDIDEGAMRALAAYHWPGNVRQLRHALERMVLLATGTTLTIDDVPPTIRGAGVTQKDKSEPRLPADGLDLKDAVEEYENALILQALERTGWNKNQAAALLRMNRTTLVERLKKKGFGSLDP
ncbi:MAG: sigma-54-dependent Fis family transcriptional regulator [Sandaracinaceae bacterium]|nr:sigma-54-dependent Fis family transcriptional regulator [Sandaracinaceae bacterium]